jgi:hypothetical protein
LLLDLDISRSRASRLIDGEVKGLIRRALKAPKGSSRISRSETDRLGCGRSLKGWNTQNRLQAGQRAGYLDKESNACRRYAVRLMRPTPSAPYTETECSSR